MNNSSKWMAYGALAIVCTVWGTTYFAIKVGVETFPPFLFSGIRHGVSGLLLLIGLKIFSKNAKLTKENIILQSILGVLMIALGNGVIGWCERYIPSGLAALIVSVIPVFVVLINYVSGTDRRVPHLFIVLGLLLGCLGIGLIFKDNLKDIMNSDYRNGLLLAFGACLSLAFGAVYSKSRPVKNSNVLLNSSLQLLSGGITLLLMSLVFDDYSELQNVGTESIRALVYLIFFGSILAYSCFVYALQALPLGISSLYAYINPFVALLLGFYLGSEPLTITTALALMAALAAIYFINKGYKKMEQKVIKQQNETCNLVPQQG